jgi:16S rRNA (cytosine967-C5)-methyltransferase
VVAARALVAVEEGWNAEDALARDLPEGPDGRLAWHIVFGVLRNRSKVDAALRPFLKQPLAALDAPVRAVLRLGAFEKLFSRTPDHAVVQQAVEVAKRAGAKRASGLVNAVLRRVREPTGMSRPEQLDHPAWLVARWDARYGPEVTDAWCARNRVIPPICLVARDAARLAETLSERDMSGAPEAMLQGVVLPRTRVVPASSDLPGVDEGTAWVQDPSSVMVADRFASHLPPGGRVLDACAAPGGKSARLWSSGFPVTSTDVEGRMLKLHANRERIAAEAPETPAWKARPFDWLTEDPAGLGTFDGVLVDAPCTGLGTLRRHPEIRWRRKPTDFEAAATKQLAILAKAADCVRSGGVLGYAVCSPAPEEGPEVFARFLEGRPEFEPVDTWSSAPPEGDEDAHQLFIARRS